MIRIILEKVLQIGGLEVLLNRVLFFRIIEDIAPEKTEEYKWLIQNYDTLNLRHIYEDCFNESEKLNLYIANISEDFLRRNKPSDTGIIKQKTENKVNKKCTNINTTNSHTQGQKGNAVAKSPSFGMLDSSQSVQKSKPKQVDVIDRKSSSISIIKINPDKKRTYHFRKLKKNCIFAKSYNDIREISQSVCENPIELPDAKFCRHYFDFQAKAYLYDVEYFIVSQPHADKHGDIFFIFRNPRGTANPPVLILNGKHVNRIVNEFKRVFEDKYIFDS